MKNQSRKREHRVPWGCVYKITYPNGKIYVGSDTAKEALYDYFTYFGTPIKARREMNEEMKEYMEKGIELVIRKEILFFKEDVEIGEILRKEKEFIKDLDSTNKEIGYNRNLI